MARTYDVGQVVRVEARFTSDGEPTSPVATPSALSLAVRAPSGTVTTYAVGALDNPETGRYSKLLTLATPGVYVAHWTASGADKVGANEQLFTVSPRGVDGFLLAFYGADPTTEPLDQVRLLVGDTDPAAFLLLDAEINWLLTRAADDVTTASIQAALAIAAKLSREVDRSLGDVSRSASQRAAAYRDLARTLSETAAAARVDATRATVPTPLAGGIDGDPYFAMGFMDSPGNSRPFGGGSDPRAGCP